MASIRSLGERGRVMLDLLALSGLGSNWTAQGLAKALGERRSFPSGPSAFIHLQALNQPHKEALVDGDLRLTYRQLDESINRLANALRANGVGPGDRVAVMMRNSHRQVLAQWSISRAGAIAVHVGYRSKTPEIVHVLRHSEPKVFLYHVEHEPEVAEAQRLAGFPAPTGMVRAPDGFDALMARSSATLPPKVPALHAGGGAMVYTSGTTGKPKGAARGFSSLAKQLPVLDFLRKIGVRSDDRHLVSCPLYHSAAPAFVALTLALGGCVVILEHFDPETALAAIEKERITSAFMVPTMLGRMVALPSATRRRYDTLSLRWIVSGAAPLPTETARRVEQAFGHILFNFYGATETGMVTLAMPSEHTSRPGTIGRKLLGNEIRLLDENGKEVPTGQVGELYARNTMLIEGYYRDRDATSRAMRDGFFSVGDMARVDEDGYYYLADRKTDMVISGGVNIYPREIEEVLHSHPDVLECAVIGVPDPDWGESLRAHVVRRDGTSVTEEELREHCRHLLSNHKCPKTIEFMDALPRNPTGKVLKRDLRQR
ncbi:MAG: AMP-binding protein [Deltaproteobacteria bacterium]|nr:AMP-binding protein [Deltaproteobacteria bacterium]